MHSLVLRYILNVLFKIICLDITKTERFKIKINYKNTYEKRFFFKFENLM